ncbi:MAG: sulfate adenylyltransferase [Verrucomicrobiales bacterium]|nr:sulfate adenylyltransferase [Verrucomicrobiales bacterium]|tara:strand:+ start:372 stop:1691 length:1320 start_codon:yes stop_codon:yes gene_type:complete
MTDAAQTIELLRFNTCGSVDDGKSTLIGRLLYDSKSIMEDQMEALERSADITGGGQVNLANLTDGLRAEREQGITIDVAYRYVATPRRKFIVADTPGHVEYTRNMVTGASTANLSIVLVDARNGVIEQTRRHSYISALLGIPHIVFAVNKMDLVDWSEERFREIRDGIEAFLPKLDLFKDVKFIPISALEGDNVVTFSDKTPWYEGPTLLGHIESVHIASDWNLNGFRFPVQWVNRPNNPTDQSLHDFRGLSGQIAGGIVKVGQKILVLPSGQKSRVKEIWTYDGPLEEAFCPQSVTLRLEDDLDISRGDTIVGLDPLPGHSADLAARVCWMNQRPLTSGKKFFLKHGTRTVQAMVTALENRVDIQTFDPEPEPLELRMNDIGEVHIRTAQPLVFDGYATNRLTGSFILVEQGTNLTVAAGMLLPPLEHYRPEYTDFAI